MTNDAGDIGVLEMGSVYQLLMSLVQRVVGRVEYSG